MIQVPEWRVRNKGWLGHPHYIVVDDMGIHVATVNKESDARLIEQLPNMVMMLQRVVADYEGMLNNPEFSHIYTDIKEVLDDAEYKEEPTH